MATRYTITAYDTCPACDGRRHHTFHRQGLEYLRDCGTCNATGEVQREAPFAEALAASAQAADLAPRNDRERGWDEACREYLADTVATVTP